MHSCAVLGNEPTAFGSIACRIPGLRVKLRNDLDCGVKPAMTVPRIGPPARKWNRWFPAA